MKRHIHLCERCGRRTIYFMVKNEVWHEAGFIRYVDGEFCLPCFEFYLGRSVLVSDLNSSDVNAEWILGECGEYYEDR